MITMLRYILVFYFRDVDYDGIEAYCKYLVDNGITQIFGKSLILRKNVQFRVDS